MTAKISLIIATLVLFTWTATAQEPAVLSIEPWVEGDIQSRAENASVSDLAPVSAPALNRTGASSDLWIDRGGIQSGYALVRQGETLDLFAGVPSGGHADIYVISTSMGVTFHSSKDITPGNYTARVHPGGAGRSILVFAVENVPAGALIIDVLPPEEEGSGPVDVSSISRGKALITVTSDWLWGYDVYVDGVYFVGDIGDGSIDGRAGLTVGSGLHTMTISREGETGLPAYRTEHTRTYDPGYHYTFKV